MNTLSELLEKMKNIDEITLIERLDISSEDIVERFVDKIEVMFDEFDKEFS